MQIGQIGRVGQMGGAPVTGVGAVSPPVGTVNWSASRLATWKTARDAVRGGSANANVLVIGDSTNLGYISSGAAGMKSNAVSTLAASRLSSTYGLPANAHNLFGDFGYDQLYDDYDTRLVVSGAWNIHGSILQFAGKTSYIGSGTGLWSFTPAAQTDTCELIYVTSGSTGVLRASVNGGSEVTQSTIASNGYGKKIITGSLGGNTYNVGYSSGGNVFLSGVIAYNSAVKQVNLINMAQGGARLDQVLNTWATPLALLSVIAPKLVVIQIGINDWLQSTVAATFSVALSGFIDNCRSAGADVLLVAPFLSSNGQALTTRQQSFLDVYSALAVSKNCVLLDINARWGGTYDAADALGYHSGDGVHGSATGYADEASALSQLLMAA